MAAFLKIFSLAWMLLFLSSGAAAQQAVNLGTLSEDEPLLIGRYVSFWETGKVIPKDEDVLAGRHDQLFQPSLQDLPGRGFIVGVIWIRLEVDNPADQAAEVYLNSRYPLLDEVSLYQRQSDGTFSKDSQGDSPPNRIGRADYRVPVFKLSVAPGRTAYYLKMATQGSSVLAFYLMKPKAHRNYQIFDMCMLTLFLGVMLTLLLYNSFLMVSFRSLTYLYYSLFLLSMTVVQFSMQGLWPTILPGQYAVWAQTTGFLLSACTTYFTAGLVTMHFLNMREHMPVIRWYFIAFLTTSTVLFPLAFVWSYNFHVKIMSGVYLLGSLGMLVSSLVAVGRGYRPAFSYSFAWLFMIVSNILLALTFEGQSHIPMVVQWGNMPGCICEGIFMSLALGDRVNYFRAKADRMIHKLNAELQQQVVKVEALVTERTETIRTIIDNVATGIVIIDRKAFVLPGFTLSCHGLLGVQLSEGENFIQLLNLRAAIEKKFRLALIQIFEDQMPQEVTLAQLPAHILVHGKYLHLDAAALRDQNGAMKHLLLTLTDATELRRRKMEAHRNRALLKILRDIDGFRQFIAYSYEAIQKLKSLQTHPSSRETAFILHTLKGNCLVFQLPEIAQTLHDLEENAELTMLAIIELEESFKKYLTRHGSLLRTPWGPASHDKRVTDQQLNALRDLSQNHHPLPLRNEIDLWIREVSAKSIRTTLQSLVNDARVVAKKMNKEVEFLVLDRDARIHSHAEELLIEELIHVVRNAIVHGIEDDREALQKPQQGYICLDFRELDDGLAISCSDDGRGFDRKVWEAEWIARGLVTDLDLSQIPLVELISKVSRGGFSTQEKLSIFAGRGIGIEALFAAVESCQGSIDILSEPGKGCRFEIFVPRVHSLQSVS